MDIKCLASSSSGNCYLISDGSSTLMLESGIRLQKVQNVIPDLTKINACLISHEHGDHSAYVKDILKYTMVCASQGTLNALNDKHQVSDEMKVFQHVLKHNTRTKIGSFIVVPFDVQHDAAEPLGFLIHSNTTNENLLFATDTYYIKNRFKDLHYIMVECNYSYDLIPEELSKPEYLRLLQSHFELSNVKEFLKANDLTKCKRIYLLHLSSRHANAKLFKQEIEELTGVPVEVCRK